MPSPPRIAINSSTMAKPSVLGPNIPASGEGFFLPRFLGAGRRAGGRPAGRPAAGLRAGAVLVRVFVVFEGGIQPPYSRLFARLVPSAQHDHGHPSPGAGA